MDNSLMTILSNSSVTMSGNLLKFVTVAMSMWTMCLPHCTVVQELELKQLVSASGVGCVIRGGAVVIIVLRSGCFLSGGVVLADGVFVVWIQ